MTTGSVTLSPGDAPCGREIVAVCHEICELLLAKNKAYGNSALDPLRVFSRADTVEQLKVRIDDKLSRISRASASELGEDAVLDLLGYLILLRIAQKSTAP